MWGSNHQGRRTAEAGLGSLHCQELPRAGTSLVRSLPFLLPQLPSCSVRIRARGQPVAAWWGDRRSVDGRGGKSNSAATSLWGTMSDGSGGPGGQISSAAQSRSCTSPYTCITRLKYVIKRDAWCYFLGPSLKGSTGGGNSGNDRRHCSPRISGNCIDSSLFPKGSAIQKTPWQRSWPTPIPRVLLLNGFLLALLKFLSRKTVHIHLHVCNVFW